MLFILKELLKCLLTFSKKYYSFQRLVQSSAASIEGCWFKHSGTFLKDMLHCFQEMCHSLYWNIAKSDATLLHLFKKNTILFQESTESIQEGSFRKYYCTYWSILRQSGVIFFSAFFCCSVFPNAFAFLKARGQNLEKRDHVVELPPFRLSKPVSLCCISSKPFINLLYILSDLLSYSLDACWRAGSKFNPLLTSLLLPPRPFPVGLSTKGTPREVFVLPHFLWSLWE